GVALGANRRAGGDEARRPRSGGGTFTLRDGKGLVVAQVALSLMMVAGATLLVGSWRRLVAVDPGFNPDGVTVVRVNARAAKLADGPLGPVYLRMLERLRAVPG